tara:strand:- start:1283 stop:2131 length:849 start_codon:yes stop_codon:yes gene_type:complete
MESYWSDAPDFKGSKVSEEWVQTNENVRLRVITWTPDSPTSEGVVVVVPGWGSVFEGWRPLISKWSSRRKIVYIETREKGSSRIDGRMTKSDFSIERISSDILRVLIHYGIESSEVDWFSSSLGSTVLIDAFNRGELSGRTSILLAPNAEFKFPIWSRLFIRSPIPKFTHSSIKRLVIWAIERKVKEEGQKIRYRRTLLSQDLHKMHLSARFLMGYSIPSDLSSISFPCAVMAASSDKLHGMEKALKIVDSIPNSVLIEVPSNQYAHEDSVLTEIEEFQTLA